MCCIDEKHFSFAFFGLFKKWLEAFFLNSSCFAGSAFFGTLPVLRNASPIDFSRVRIGVSVLRMPVSCSILVQASLTLVGGCFLKYSSRALRCLFRGASSPCQWIFFRASIPPS